MSLEANIFSSFSILLFKYCSGYMSPEYALDGMISVKSDVYSFGVLLLETVSGRKMKGFFDADPNNNLLGHVRSYFAQNV